MDLLLQWFLGLLAVAICGSAAWFVRFLVAHARRMELKFDELLEATNAAAVERVRLSSRISRVEEKIDRAIVG